MRTFLKLLACVVFAGAASVARAQTAQPPAAAPAQPAAAAPAQPTPAQPTPAQPRAAALVQPVPPPAAPASTQPPAAAPPPTADAPATPPPPAADAAAPAELPSTVLDTPVIQACNPSCRTGFQCVQGSCVSVCNPPCVIGDVCTEHGDCVRQPTPPLPGDAKAAEIAAGVHMHDGFFLRMATGPSGGAVSLDQPDEDERTYSGGGWTSSLDIGGAVVRDLVVFGRIGGAWLVDPKLRVDGKTTDSNADHFAGHGFLGVGINYYVMPINIYFGGAIGLASVSLARHRRGEDDQNQDSDAGFGIDLDAGKEWWVGDNWGLGVAVRLSLASVPGGDDFARDTVFGSGFVAVLFSATYQ